MVSSIHCGARPSEVAIDARLRVSSIVLALGPLLGHESFLFSLPPSLPPLSGAALPALPGAFARQPFPPRPFRLPLHPSGRWSLRGRQSLPSQPLKPLLARYGSPFYLMSSFETQCGIITFKYPLCSDIYDFARSHLIACQDDQERPLDGTMMSMSGSGPGTTLVWARHDPCRIRIRHDAVLGRTRSFQDKGLAQQCSGPSPICACRDEWDAGGGTPRWRSLSLRMLLRNDQFSIEFLSEDFLRDDSGTKPFRGVRRPAGCATRFGCRAK